MADVMGPALLAQSIHYRGPASSNLHRFMARVRFEDACKLEYKIENRAMRASRALSFSQAVDTVYPITVIGQNIGVDLSQVPAQTLRMPTRFPAKRTGFGS